MPAQAMRPGLRGCQPSTRDQALRGGKRSPLRICRTASGASCARPIAVIAVCGRSTLRGGCPRAISAGGRQPARAASAISSGRQRNAQLAIWRALPARRRWTSARSITAAAAGLPPNDPGQRGAPPRGKDCRDDDLQVDEHGHVLRSAVVVDPLVKVAFAAVVGDLRAHDARPHRQPAFAPRHVWFSRERRHCGPTKFIWPSATLISCGSSSRRQANEPAHARHAQIFVSLNCGPSARSSQKLALHPSAPWIIVRNLKQLNVRPPLASRLSAKLRPARFELYEQGDDRQGSSTSGARAAKRGLDPQLDRRVERRPDFVAQRLGSACVRGRRKARAARPTRRERP